jgi:hypothetical protein
VSTDGHTFKFATVLSKYNNDDDDDDDSLCHLFHNYIKSNTDVWKEFYGGGKTLGHISLSIEAERSPGCAASGALGAALGDSQSLLRVTTAADYMGARFLYNEDFRTAVHKLQQSDKGEVYYSLADQLFDTCQGIEKYRTDLKEKGHVRQEGGEGQRAPRRRYQRRQRHHAQRQDRRLAHAEGL